MGLSLVLNGCLISLYNKPLINLVKECHYFRTNETKTEMSMMESATMEVLNKKIRDLEIELATTKINNLMLQAEKKDAIRRQERLERENIFLSNELEDARLTIDEEFRGIREGINAMKMTLPKGNTAGSRKQRKTHVMKINEGASNPTKKWNPAYQGAHNLQLSAARQARASKNQTSGLNVSKLTSGTIPRKNSGMMISNQKSSVKKPNTGTMMLLRTPDSFELPLHGKTKGQQKQEPESSN